MLDVDSYLSTLACSTTQTQKQENTMKQVELEMDHTRLTGQPVAKCPECHIVVVHWDSDDLDENGALFHECDGGAE